MSDTLSSLLGSASAKDQPENNPNIRAKVKKVMRDGKWTGKWFVEGDGSGKTFSDEASALAHAVATTKDADPLHGEGPMMTTGESAMDWGDEHQPGAKTPNSETTPANAPEGQEKPAWVIESEKRSGVTYEYDPSKKAWRPKKGVDRAAAAKQMPQGAQQ
jgi:hypothetical protein